MKTITFAHDWNNKLTGPNKIFTTIRKWNTGKEEYYRAAIGEVFGIILGKVGIGKAKLIRINVIGHNQINEALLYTDTGLTDIEKIKKLFENFGIKGEDLAIVLVFEKEKNDKLKAHLEVCEYCKGDYLCPSAEIIKGIE
jgi:hypothetical protein